MLHETYGGLILAMLVPAALVAGWYDYRWHRVPNWLNAALAFTGLFVQFVLCGTGGLINGLLGMAAGFALLIVLWAMKAMGAGDVKLMAAIGAWLGPETTLHAVLAGGLIGGVIALGMLAWRRNWRDTAANFGLLAVKVTSLRTAFSEMGSTRSLAASGSVMPYAIPLTLGTLIVLISDYSGWWRLS